LGRGSNEHDTDDYLVGLYLGFGWYGDYESSLMSITNRLRRFAIRHRARKASIRAYQDRQEYLYSLEEAIARSLKYKGSRG